MASEDWRVAAAALRARCANVGRDQVDLANKLDLKLPQRIPGLVAAQLIRDHLAGPLRQSSASDPTHGQVEFLHDLCEALGVKYPSRATTNALASAWIEVLQARRALAALKELAPRPGDIVHPSSQPDDVGVIVSVSNDGRINVAGRGGRGIPAHRAVIVARASDADEWADDFRRRAANRRALRERQGDGPPSPAKAALLEPFRADGIPGPAEIELLREAIESAEDEKPVQACLQAHPQLVARLAGLTSFGAFVRSQVELGSQLVPDFMLAVADSAGVHWTLIELESPRAQVGIRNGRLAGKAREGVQQIEDWREWILSNLDYARRPPTDNGLGLVEIRPESPGIVLIGRRDAMSPASDAVRRRLLEQRNIALHSYDWLLDALEAGFARPGGPLDWPDWADRV